MDKVAFVQFIGNEVCEGCGPDADCGLDPNECTRIISAIVALDAILQVQMEEVLKILGQYVDNLSDDDGHNDKVVDNAYKLLQEVVAKWD
jgi:hypothetical protein